MMCVSPLTFKRDGTLVTVPCGKCIECLERKRNDWSIRLQNELKSVKSGYSYFVTLTYAPESVPCVYDEYDNLLGYTLVREHVSKFVRSIRDRFRYAARLQGIDNKVFKFRYFACGEYGIAGLRPHYHLMLFGFLFDYDFTYDVLSKCWHKGFVSLGYLRDGGCHYQAKYMVKPSGLPEQCIKPFCQGSKYLGLSYLDDDMLRYHRDPSSRVLTNRRKFVAVPRYYRTRIFTDKISRDMAAKIQRDKYMDYINSMVGQYYSEREYEQNRAAYISRKTQNFYKLLHHRKL